MNQQQSLLRSPPITIDSPFSGIWIRWSALTQAERFVCASLVLIPLWWWIGWGYIPLLLLLSVVSYEILNQKELYLQRPSLTVVSALSFGLYRLISEYINEPAVTPSFFINGISRWICFGLILWYIQSNDIRVRPQVVAWAFSVSVVQMLGFWIIVHFVFSEPYYNPPRSLFGLLTAKSERFIPGAGNGNYLRPYEPGEKGIGGLARFSFFFSHPEILALVASFTSLIALDIKKRYWSLLLFIACSFLLLLSQTRSAWLVFPIVLMTRYVFISGKAARIAVLCSLLAVGSFVTLSLPSVTEVLTDTYKSTAEATTNLRQESTDARSKIYVRTLEGFQEEPIWGHGVNGPSVVPGYEPARIGSHSFIIGTLLYKSGLLGTAIFITFWASLILWLYNTRLGRPICCFLMILYFSLTTLVMEIELVGVLVILLCTILREKKMKLTRRIQNA